MDNKSTNHTETGESRWWQKWARKQWETLLNFKLSFSYWRRFVSPSARYSLNMPLSISPKRAQCRRWTSFCFVGSDAVDVFTVWTSQYWYAVNRNKRADQLMSTGDCSIANSQLMNCWVDSARRRSSPLNARTWVITAVYRGMERGKPMERKNRKGNCQECPFGLHLHVSIKLYRAQIRVEREWMRLRMNERSRKFIIDMECRRARG